MLLVPLVLAVIQLVEQGRRKQGAGGSVDGDPERPPRKKPRMS